jgi:hypothetical protein
MVIFLFFFKKLLSIGGKGFFLKYGLKKGKKKKKKLCTLPLYIVTVII